jgi:hypothetical protein
MLQQSHQNGSNTLPTDSIWQGVQTNIQYKKTTPQGDSDYREVRDEIQNALLGGSIDTPIELKP